MGETTGISWTDHTFNPWIGCAKVSEACKHCYAEVNTFARRSRARGLELWGVDEHRHITSESTWDQPRRWNEAAKRDGVRRRVFCASLADVFEDRRDLDDARDGLFELIEQCDALDWQLLTKRPECVMRLVPEQWRARFPSHVWIGTTVENQERADERIPHLSRVPAAIRFLSCEPLLGALDLRRWLRPRILHTNDGRYVWNTDPGVADVGGTWWFGVNWIIVGGESGQHARAFDLGWAHSLVAQGDDASVPVFFKQAGAKWFNETLRTSRRGAVCVDPLDRWTFVDTKDPKGGDLSEIPGGPWPREFPTTK